MAVSVKAVEDLLRHKHYKALITYLKQHEHPIINILENYTKYDSAVRPDDLKIEHIQLSDDDIDGLIHEMQTIHLEKRLQRIVNLIVGIGAILIGIWGIYSTVIGDLSRAYFIIALPIGLSILYFAVSSE